MLKTKTSKFVHNFNFYFLKSKLKENSKNKHAAENRFAKFRKGLKRYLNSCSYPCRSSTLNSWSAAKWKDSSRRKCFDCKHWTDAVAADTLDGGAIESNFGFYRRSAAAAVDCRLTAHHSTGLTDLIHDVDKSARFVIYRNRFVVWPARLAAFAVLVADFVIYLALCERWVGREVRYSSVGDLRWKLSVSRMINGFWKENLTRTRRTEAGNGRDLLRLRVNSLLGRFSLSGHLREVKNR